MKVIKIKKSYRSGIKEHFLVLEDWRTEEGIVCEVEDWCDEEPSGSNYGYSYKWEYVTDETLIKSIIEKKIKITQDQIDIDLAKKNNLENYLNELSHEQN